MLLLDHNAKIFLYCCCRLVLQRYQELMTKLPDYARRKVLAGLVMTTNSDCSDGQIISLSTGTKCVGGEHISVKGDVTESCRNSAGVLVRRSTLARDSSFQQVSWSTAVQGTLVIQLTRIRLESDCCQTAHGQNLLIAGIRTVV